MELKKKKTLAQYLEGKNEERKGKYGKLLDALKLPAIKDWDDNTMPDRFSMPLTEFQKLMGKPGKAPGRVTEEVPGTCLAGSSVLAWVTGGTCSDEDYFSEDIPTAQSLVNLLLKKGYEFTGYQGMHAEMNAFEQAMTGKEDAVWKPVVRDIESWYCGGSVMRCSSGKCLPTETRDPLLPVQHEDMVRALNFWKKPKERQVVLVIRGEPAEVIDTFDLSISQWAIANDTIYWGRHTIQDTVRNRVHIMRIHHPWSTIRRVLKYANRGYYFCNGALLQVCRAVAHFADAREAANLPVFENQVISLD